MEEKYYTVDQIAKLLKMHPKTIQRYIREGKLRASKVGKGWRVTGHDLSVFTEGTGTLSYKEETPRSAARLEANSIDVSAVIDLPVTDTDQAVRIVNMVTAALNSKPPEYNRSTMSSCYLESERKLRLMLWGTLGFMEIMFHSITGFTSREEEA